MMASRNNINERERERGDEIKNLRELHFNFCFFLEIYENICLGKSRTRERESIYLNNDNNDDISNLICYYIIRYCCCCCSCFAYVDKLDYL